MDISSTDQFNLRNHSFLSGFDETKQIQRREATEVRLRKEKRESAACSRRFRPETLPASLSSRRSTLADTPKRSIPDISKRIRNAKTGELLEDIVALRQTLSRPWDYGVQQVIDSGLVDVILDCISDFSQPRLQFEASWVLINLTHGSSQQVRAVVQKGAIPRVLDLFKTQDKKIAEHALWIVGNLSSDSIIFRDQILSLGGINIVAQAVDQLAWDDVDIFGAWSLTNLCRGSPPPHFDQIFTAIGPVSNILLTHDASETVESCLWALYHIATNRTVGISEIVCNESLLARILQLATLSSTGSQTVSLKLINKICLGNGEQTSILLKAGVLSTLKLLIVSGRQHIQKDAAFAIGNLTSTRTCAKILKLGIPPQLYKLMDCSHDLQLLRTAIHTLTTLIEVANDVDIAHLITTGILDVLVTGLKIDHDSSVILRALTGVNEVLKKAYCREEVVERLEHNGGVEQIDKLQAHSNKEVYQTTLGIIENYFSPDEDPLLTSIRDIIG